MKNNDYDFWDELGLFTPMDFFKKKNWAMTRRLLILSAGLAVTIAAFSYIYVGFLIWLWYA